jgi:hypothetical protein
VLLEQRLGRGDYNFKHVDKVACQPEGTIAFVLEDGVIPPPLLDPPARQRAADRTRQRLNVPPLGHDEALDDPEGLAAPHDEYETEEAKG